MSRIVRAVNIMINNRASIQDVMNGPAGNNEIFFLYAMKHKWSVLKAEGTSSYSLHYYPGTESISELAQMDEQERVIHPNYVNYRDEFRSTEGEASIIELFEALKEKMFGMDEVLDDIIGHE